MFQLPQHIYDNLSVVPLKYPNNRKTESVTSQAFTHWPVDLGNSLGNLSIILEFLL